MFFFSSRRRHTRFDCDWSSDVCSSDLIVPVIGRLVRKGLPVGCAMSYMLAAPIVNPIVGLSTWAAFQGRDPVMMVCARLGVGFVIAVLAGFVLSRIPITSLLRGQVLAGIRQAREEVDTPRAPRAPGEGVVTMLRSAQRDFLDVALYFFIGVAIAA